MHFSGTSYVNNHLSITSNKYILDFVYKYSGAYNSIIIYKSVKF